MPTTTPPTATDVSKAIHTAANPEHAVILRRFFKTGPGEYGEGDQFIGLKVPVIRRVVRQFRNLPLSEALDLLQSPIHEIRLAALLFMVQKFAGANPAGRREIFRSYLRNTRCINNWDLVDLSAPQIVGGSLTPAGITLLRKLARSPLLWERRIAILATFTFIRQNSFVPTLELCETLMHDKHDLMHKACGWMLREVGKRDRPTLIAFLNKHAATMPRTMLRYSIEHFPEPHRRMYLWGMGSKKITGRLLGPAREELRCKTDYR